MHKWIAVGFCLLAASVQAQTDPQETGVLVVESGDVNAAVLVDGTIRGRTPDTLVVPAGAHLIRLALTGYTAYETTALVPPGDTLRITADMERMTGVVSLNALPPDATATVDGVPLQSSQTLPTGLSRVVVSRPGYPNLRAVVPVAPNAETSIAYDEAAFRPGRALLAVAGPGVLQVRDGRRTVGALYATAVLGGIATALVTSISADQAARDIGPALDLYDQAQNEPDAVAAREEVERLTATVRTSRQLRGGALVAAGLVYAVSLIDSFAFHVRQPALVTTAPRLPVVGAVLSGDGFGLAFSL